MNRDLPPTAAPASASAHDLPPTPTPTRTSGTARDLPPTATPTRTSGTKRDLLPTSTPARTRAAARELLRPHRALACGALAVMVVATTVGLLTQPLLGHIVDLVTEHRPAGTLTAPVLLLALIGAVQGVSTAFGMTLVAKLGETALAELRERFVERALRLPLDRLEKAGAGDLTARVTRDVSRVAEAVRSALPELARSGLAIMLTLGALALLDWRFLAAVLLAVPFQAYTARWYTAKAAPLYAKERVATGAQQQQLLDTIGGAATVRAYRLEAEHTERVTERSRAAVELTLRGVRLVLGFHSRLHVGEYTGLAAVLVVGFALVRDGSASIGTATAAALYFHSLFGPINTALVLLDDAQSASAGLARLVGVVDEPVPEGEPAQGAHQDASEASPQTAAGPRALYGEPIPRTIPPVTLTGVCHAYAPGRPVLHDVDLVLRPGERVALVGASGAGKTTLAKLIAGIHRPTSGRIDIGGAEPVESGRTVALVTQEVHVFAGPLTDNLRLARPGATDRELRAALAAVGALAWAEALPDGPATVVGKGGHRLTADRAQQLALARLVLADPPVAVLDEATAEAGSSGAHLLEKAADRALEGRTALIVAHRLSQAAAADRIVVLENGRVAESGTHDELRAAGGPYAELWRAWSRSRSTEP